MNEEMLRLYLIGFIILFVIVLVFWRSFAKITSIRKSVQAEKGIITKRLRRLHTIYLAIFSLFVVMTLLFVFTPDWYQFFLPIEILNKPVINITGFLILKIFLVWVVVVQRQLDTAVFKYSRKIDELSSMELVYFCERLLIQGLLVMFIGMFVTLSNIIALLLCTIALGHYCRKDRKGVAIRAYK